MPLHCKSVASSYTQALRGAPKSHIGRTSAHQWQPIPGWHWRNRVCRARAGQGSGARVRELGFDFRRKLDGERGVDQLLLGDRDADAGERVDQLGPGQPGRAMLVRVAADNQIDRVTQLGAVAVWRGDLEVVAVAGDRCSVLDLRSQTHDDVERVRIVGAPPPGHAPARLEIIGGIKNALDTVPRLDQSRNPDESRSVLMHFVRGHRSSVSALGALTQAAVKIRSSSCFRRRVLVGLHSGRESF